MEYINRGSSSTQRGELSSEGSISLSKGESIDAYKEKIEHFKVLVVHLQNELQSNKMRKEGAETVSKLLQESKKEGIVLQKKIKTLESAIRNLQSRLELHGLSTEITLQDGETYIPSHSKQLLDNLTRENTRLRGLIRNASGDPEELDRMQKEIHNLEAKNNETEQRNEELKSQIVELENVLKASDNDKDSAIKRLRDELDAANNELNKRGYECLSLAEERSTLKNQLKEVAQKCQELALKLEKQRSMDSRSPFETEITQTKSAESDEKMIKLQEDNALLNAKVKEITEMNKRWQEYNQQRDTILNQLQKELADFKDKDKLHEAKTANLERAMQEQLHRILEDAQRNVLRANQERDQYKQNLEESNRKLSLVTEQLSQKRPTTQTAEPEIIEALKQQIQICTEDFESERKDREKVQSKLHRALSENDHLKKEMENLKKERVVTTPQLAEHQQYNDPFYHYQLPGPHGNFGAEQLATRGVSGKNLQYYSRDKYNVIDGANTDLQSDFSFLNMPVEGDPTDQTGKVSLHSKDSDERFCSLKSLSSSSDPPRLTESKTSSVSPRNSSLTNEASVTRKVDILKCPKCDKEYSSDEHADLLDHIELCCE